MATQQLPITSPIKGVVRAVPREGQPPATAWDAQNCLPYDRYGRLRLSQRAGLKKEFNVQLSDGTNFIQGMLEAPNIIYPPGTFPETLGSITDLIPGPFTFDVPGTVGPFSHDYPTGPVGTNYEWDFSVTYTLSATTDDDPWGLSTVSTTTILYWPLNSGDVTQTLILIVGTGGQLGNLGGFFHPSMEISVALYTGDPSLTIPSWTRLTGTLQYDTTPADGVMTATITSALTLIIGADASFNITMTPTSGGSVSPQHGAIGFGILTYPELHAQSVEIDPFAGGSGTTGCTQTLTITD